MTLPPRLAVLVGTWSAPADQVAWIALGAGVVALAATTGVLRPLASTLQAPRGRFLGGACLISALLTLAYVAHYLRGGPRIIDATSYWLQAKAFARGHVAWPIAMPTASFRGRFLLSHEPGVLAGIFPPGWPLLLSIGFVLGAPLLVGSALAAALTAATYALAREITSELPEDQRESVARTAAILSIVCAALRYHTADPMAHAACALAITLALRAALIAARDTERAHRQLLVVGICIGWVASTRLVSTIPILIVAIAITRHRGWRGIVRIAIGALPGIVLLALAQHAATGSIFEPTQRAYYAVSDGPPDCFRYGFGANVGCLHEHADFVRARLPNGFGLTAALGTTLRRLHLHLSDAFSAWPTLLLLLPLCASVIRRDTRARWLAAVVVLQIATYAPFYFDGNYPGGGARFFAEILPIEHVLAAFALASWRPTLDAERKTSGLVGLVLVGFALHSSHDHLALADRDGGRPMFEPERLQDAHIESGLLFFDTDHGFNLAYDPGVTDPKRGLVVARLHNDGHDRLLFDELGHPPTWAYRFGPDVTVQPFTPIAATDSAGHEQWRFEAEAEWPPLRQHGAWAEPTWVSGTCASGGQVLTVRSTQSTGTVELPLPIPRAGRWSIQPHLFTQMGDGPVQIMVRGTAIAWIETASPRPDCSTLPPQIADFPKGEAMLELAAPSGQATLDWIEVMPGKD